MYFVVAVCQHRLVKSQICKDKKTTLLESMDKVKLSYSQLTAQTAELTQQVLHMTSRVRSQVCLLITSGLPCSRQLLCCIVFILFRFISLYIL